MARENRLLGHFFFFFFVCTVSFFRLPAPSTPSLRYEQKETLEDLLSCYPSGPKVPAALPSFCYLSKSSSVSLVQFSRSVVSDSLRPHESQHTRPPCPSPTPGVYSNSCPSSRSCHPAISSSVVPFSSCPQSLPASGIFPMSHFCMRWPKYWSFSFSISPSNEHPGLISFRMDWLDLLAVQGTLKSIL